MLFIVVLEFNRVIALIAIDYKELVRALGTRLCISIKVL